MIKKIVLAFLATLLFFFISPAVQAQNTVENSISKAGETLNDLKSFEKIPGAEEISLIAATIKKISTAYQTVKLQITNIIDYFQKIIQFSLETLEKIKNGGLKIKNYIENKISYISGKYEVKILLT